MKGAGDGFDLVAAVVGHCASILSLAEATTAVSQFDFHTACQQATQTEVIHVRCGFSPFLPVLESDGWRLNEFLGPVRVDRLRQLYLEGVDDAWAL
jgi:hypothetical protein